MKLKKDVRVDRSWAAALVFAVVDRVYDSVGHEAVMTSGIEGTHSRGSRHYSGLAWDFRTNFLADHGKKEYVRDEIAKRLGGPEGDFDVILESTHLHIEYDPEPLVK